MPPKKKGGGGNSGGAPKVTVDKTFGMKNKKGAKAQQQIKVIQQQQSLRRQRQMCIRDRCILESGPL